MTPLETLIEQQAKLLRKMEELMARDPATEFARVEGNVGASKHFLPCPKVESKIIDIIPIPNPYIINASVYPQLWKIFATLSFSGLALSARPVLKMEWDYNADFTRPVTCYRYFKRDAQITSFTANTGTVYYFMEETFPLRYRFLRVTIGSASEITRFIFTTREAAYFGGVGPLLVEIYGE